MHHTVPRPDIGLANGRFYVARPVKLKITRDEVDFMGVLDELKKEAEKSQLQQEQQESEAAAKRVELERKLLTRVDDLFCYFKEFEQQLKLANPNVTGAFDAGGLCTLTNLTQGEYKLTTRDVGDVRKFSFQYTCTGSGVREVKLANMALAEQKRELLTVNNLKCRIKIDANDRCQLLIHAFVPISFQFEVDADKAAVRLRVKNKPMLGVANYSYAADQINAEFMDEVAKYILDKPNRFAELSGNAVPEDALSRIREQLAKDKAKTKAKLAAGNDQPGAGGLKGILTKPLFGKKS